jgi:hypothetical protein
MPAMVYSLGVFELNISIKAGSIETVVSICALTNWLQKMMETIKKILL